MSSKYKFTPEHRLHLSLALKGNKAHLGHKHSKETKQQFSITRKGKPSWMRTEESRQNLSKARKAAWARLTPEERRIQSEHLREATRGKPAKPEHIAKRTIAVKIAWTSPELRKAKSESMIGNSYGLGYRFTPEQRQRASETHRGEQSPLWQGGITDNNYPPEFGNPIKYMIRQRDNFTCQLCRIPENGRKHDVHHINHNKYDNAEDNLITLCHTCHAKAGHYRKDYQPILASLIVEHFNRRNNN